VADIVSLRAEARANAAADARGRAEQLAREAGVTLGRISMISEYSYNDSYYGDPYYSAASTYSMSMDAASGEIAAPSITPGVTTYSTSVSITYFIAE